MAHKITRIFLNSLASVFVGLVLLSFALLLALQSYTFQSWLGKKTGAYLSKELGTSVEIPYAKINFFTSLELQKVLIYDLHHDTLFKGNIEVNIRMFNLRDQILELKQTTLSNATIKLLYYKNENNINSDFIIRYFSTEDTLPKQPSNWKFSPGELELNNIAFTYKDERDSSYDSKHIDYDNLSITRLKGHFKNIDFSGDSIRAEVQGLSFHEKSGFKLKDLSAKVTLNATHLLAEQLRLRTVNTFIKGKIAFNHQQWDDYADFIYKVEMNCALEDSSKVTTSDLAFFAKELDGLNQIVNLSGKVKGTVNNLRLSEMRILLGDYTRYKGYLSIQGLPEIETSFIHLDANEFSTHYKDLVNIPSYPFQSAKPLPIPEQIKILGPISFSGKFDGFFSDFTTHGKFTTAIGKANTRLSLQIREKQNDIEYHGKISTDQFDIGKLLGVEALGSLSMSGDLDGSGSDLNSIAAGFNFEINNLSYNNYNYKDISVKGHLENKLFNGLMNSLDSNFNFDFNGSIDFNKKVPDLAFISTINRLNLSALHFFTMKDSGIISAQVLIDTRGNSIDDLSGQIHLDNLVYNAKGKRYKLSNFDLNLDQETANKNITLNSDYLNASLSGRYALGLLPGVFQSFMYTYYPTFFKQPIQPTAYRDSLALKINIKNFNTIHDVFLNDYMFSRDSKIELLFDAGKSKFDLSGNFPVFSYQDFTFYGTQLQANESGQNLNANISTRSITLNDSNLVNQMNLLISSNDKNINYSLAWNNQDTLPNFGKLKGGLSFNPKSFDIRCDTIEIKNAFNNWKLKSPSLIAWLNDGSLRVEPLVLNNAEQEISISGNYTTSESDSLVVNTKAVDMSSFNPILRLFGLKFNGLLNGEMVFSNPNKVFVFRGNVGVKNFKLNDNALGEVVLKTNYDNAGKFIKLKGQTSLGLGEFLGGKLEDITFSGDYFLDGREEAIDIDFIANTANLRLLNPLLKDILTINNGFVKGLGHVHGNPKHIKIDSKLNLFQSNIKVDYTGVTYFVTGEIEIMPDQIRFSDLLLRDRSMKSPVVGTLNGNIFHDNFENIRLDYDLNYKNMLALNTTENDNPYYFGKVFGSGNLGIYGYVNNLNMEINTSVEKNTKFVLPLDGPAELSDDGYIHFVVKDTLKRKKENVLTGFNLDMNLKISPEAQLSILMDRKTGDILNVQGQGNLDLNINTLGKFDMLGDYIITEGEYLFTLKTLINKKFEIDAGSHITWSGDPMNAEIDVSTRYRQRASVAPLLNDTTGLYGARQPVDCRLLISGKLATPNINFKIDVPNLEPTAMARIDNVLSDEAELNRQVFSFLLFRSFSVPQIYTSQGGGVSAGSAAAATGSEMLSNRASEFINSYFGNLTGISDMQVGVNYRPGTSYTGEEFDVALSKQFMNNRITVDGNFGVNSNPNSNSSGLIGDVIVEYKLSEDGRYRMKVFNQTNDNTQVTILGGPYTQGIGVFYREEFNTFKELMDYYMKKSGKNKKATKP
ncbi:MAG: translocation/assembly module TamB [Bacteroidia bacterium]|nr:translocation/assembly module TamB [Bacteroidia bacterium]